MTTVLLTVQEVADTARVDHKTVRRAIQRGELAALRPGWQIRITPEAMQAWMERKSA